MTRAVSSVNPQAVVPEELNDVEAALAKAQQELERSSKLGNFKEVGQQHGDARMPSGSILQS